MSEQFILYTTCLLINVVLNFRSIKKVSEGKKGLVYDLVVFFMIILGPVTTVPNIVIFTKYEVKRYRMKKRLAQYIEQRLWEEVDKRGIVVVDREA